MLAVLANVTNSLANAGTTKAPKIYPPWHNKSLTKEMFFKLAAHDDMERQLVASNKKCEEAEALAQQKESARHLHYAQWDPTARDPTDGTPPIMPWQDYTDERRTEGAARSIVGVRTTSECDGLRRQRGGAYLQTEPGAHRLRPCDRAW